MRSLREAQSKVPSHSCAPTWLSVLPLSGGGARRGGGQDGNQVARGSAPTKKKPSPGVQTRVTWASCLQASYSGGGVPHGHAPPARAPRWLFYFYLSFIFYFIGLETGERERAEWNAESRLNARVELLESEAIATRRSIEAFAAWDLEKMIK